ncbi:MAG: hypothetical protein LBU95_01245 [Rikenellaceae bacterium]|nr:hypothetical protein [Rikenellaceae bacterium]
MPRNKGRIVLLAEPRDDSREILTVESYKDKGEWHVRYIAPDGYVPQGFDQIFYSPNCAVVGSADAEWVKVRAAIWIVQTCPKGLKGKRLVAWIDSRKEIADTLHGWVKGSVFAANMIPKEQFVYTPSPGERFFEHSERMSERANAFRESIGNTFDFDGRFPFFVLVLLVVNLCMMGMPDRFPGLKLALDYITLLAAFVLELLYIVVLEEKFWWCEPDQMGWIKAILFFLVTLVLAVYQFFRFFQVLDAISERSRPFNTWVGVTLFTAVTVVMFVYAIFTGGLDDEQNLILIYVLVGTQALQMVISAVQLRRYPLYGLMVLLFIPLGTFAVLLSFLRMFAILSFFALIGLVIYSFASGRGSGDNPASVGGGKGGYIQEGDSIRDSEGIYYDRVPSDQEFGHGSGFNIIRFNGSLWKRRGS